MERLGQVIFPWLLKEGLPGALGLLHRGQHLEQALALQGVFALTQDRQSVGLPVVTKEGMQVPQQLPGARSSWTWSA